MELAEIARALGRRGGSRTPSITLGPSTSSIGPLPSSPKQTAAEGFLAPMPARRETRAGGPGADLLGAVGELLTDLAGLGYQPTLIGGMALVVLGSPRVTRDFDFPLPAREVRARSRRTRIRSFVGNVASRRDLILMKTIAAGDRDDSRDAQDLEFLKRT